LLLDEPTNGLDPEAALRVRELLRRHADGGGAAIVSTHLLDMAERLCDRLVVIHHGRKVADGSAQQLRTLAGVGRHASAEEAFFGLVAT
jgi:ABC-2 type transport system ATP-binding protein